MFTSLSEAQLKQRNKIHREYNRLRGDKIVLVEDFFGSAVSPALKEGDALQAIYGEAAVKIQKNLETLLTKRKRPPFGILYPHLKQDSQDRIIEAVQPEVEAELIRYKTEQETAARERIIAWGGDPAKVRVSYDQTDDEIKQWIQENLLANRGFVGVYLADIVDAMNMQKSMIGTTGVEQYETVSLRKGEGAVALKFWQSVNNLIDYSDLFDDFPDLPSKREKPEAKANPLWGWVPGAQGGGWQPA